jgi:translocation and assembly module TamB
VANLPLAWLEAVNPTALTELGLQSDLLLAGQWEATQTDTLHAVATLERSSGDLRLLAETGAQHPLAANLSEARLQVNLDGGHLSGSLRWDSERAGKALLAVSTQLTPHLGGWQLPADAPLGGSLQMQLPPVNAWSALAPPGWRLRGTMEADITLAGTLAQPQWAGRLQARDLALRSAVDGIDFSHGSLLARLHGQQLDIQHFSLQGAGGTDPNSGQPNRVDVTGTLLWLTDKPDAAPAARLRMTLQAQIKALRVSARPDRRVVVSGQLTAQLDDARLSLRGALKADSALLTLPDDSTPQLGRDVVLRQPAPAASAPAPGAVKAARPAKPPKPVAAGSRISPDLQLELDLGSDFQVRGLGVVTRLAGKLTLTTQDLAAPRLSGVVRTVDGTYQAYGQRLQIERGLLRFTGAPDNPALTVLAIRPNLSQRVGVQIIGTALSPIVQLYADPDLPEAEKLGWLVLGRAPDSDGAETALMQQAALALLGGNGRSLSDSLAQALGLDELSLAAGSSTSSADGSTSAASITLGKRLSKDFYVSYENSLNGALGMIHVFYDLSRHLTLRAQTGEQSAIDLIYTLRYD